MIPFPLCLLALCSMHNVLRLGNLGDFRTSDGENTWVKRENQAAEVRVAQASPRQSNVPNVDAWSQLIKLRGTLNAFQLLSHSLLVNFDNKVASFRHAKSHSTTA